MIKRQRHTIAGAFVFLLLGIFAVSATVMVLLGVRFYRAQSVRSEQTSEFRILSSYVRSMLRAQDAEHLVGTDTIDGIEMLTLTENYDGIDYVTRIYAYDGKLREWFSEADYEFDPAQGEEIYDAQEMHIEQEDGLLNILLTDHNGQDVTVRIAPRAELVTVADQ